MDFLERLRVVGASFVVFDLDLDNAALPPLSGDPNDVQDIGNARPVGGLCEHVRRTLMHDAKHIGAGGGARHRFGALLSPRAGECATTGCLCSPAPTST